MSVSEICDGSLLRASVAAPTVGLDELAPRGPVLVVAPHPDDETFGCGMAIAAAAANGRRIVLALLTDGEASHAASDTCSRDDLVTLRSGELAQALDILVPDGDVPLLRLGAPDGRSRPDDELVQSLHAFARKHSVCTVWTTWHADPHCDHETAALVGAEVARALAIPMWEYAVWGRFGERAVPASMVTFHDTAMAGRKRAAIAAYRSQTDESVVGDPTGFTMPRAFVSHFASHPEVFFRA
ncbi:hypothetical protein GRI62_09775 [Erythrobacter arachoides]|uniref:PIG-L family deacetylase n=1 Tax=Aurantiacibacter arachoides TaxID=1850444 RepID=A0A845A395_9SPHN|nr:PIG-L family deacetylase [Aurantiacibacter arachoides]MXO93892.1 hypothetical protein [Aurantiacibacter arachoides]GGD45858.1 PIG-L domain-containing protein [Aurantiacibacter arachoides]